jgi:hypothetical protein
MGVAHDGRDRNFRKRAYFVRAASLLTRAVIALSGILISEADRGIPSQRDVLFRPLDGGAGEGEENHAAARNGAVA